jgi:serine/threonine protein kinase
MHLIIISPIRMDIHLYDASGKHVETIVASKTLNVSERTHVFVVLNPLDASNNELIVLKLFANDKDFQKEHRILTELRAKLSRADSESFSLGHPSFYDVQRADTKDASFGCIVFRHYRYTLQYFMLRYMNPYQTHILSSLYKELMRLLGLLQSLRLVHADIKPENLFIDIGVNPQTREIILNRLILNDFEFSQFIPPGPPSLILQGPVGTPVYMSPAMIRANQLDLKTDTWSAACILVNCLTLYLKTDTTVAYLHLYGDQTTNINTILYTIPQIPEKLCAYIQEHLLHKDATALQQLIAEIDTTIAKSSQSPLCTDFMQCLSNRPYAKPAGFSQWVFLDAAKKLPGYDDIIQFIFKTVLSYASKAECRELLDSEEVYEDDFEDDEQTGGLGAARELRKLGAARQKHTAYLRQYHADRMDKK